jgi:hypothetical protein
MRSSADKIRFLNVRFGLVFLQGGKHRWISTVGNELGMDAAVVFCTTLHNIPPGG